jgi:hypothetical protein
VLAFPATRTFQIWSAILDGLSPRIAGIQSQRNFFDHRARQDERQAEKYEYICQNLARAGLASVARVWPYVFVGEAAADLRGNGRLRSIASTCFPTAFGKNFIDHLLRIAISQYRIVLIIFSPVENVAVIRLRCLHVLADVVDATFA